MGVQERLEGARGITVIHVHGMDELGVRFPPGPHFVTYPIVCLGASRLGRNLLN